MEAEHGFVLAGESLQTHHQCLKCHTAVGDLQEVKRRSRKTDGQRVKCVSGANSGEPSTEHVLHWADISLFNVCFKKKNVPIKSHLIGMSMFGYEDKTIAN